jgi:hypothetical protein
MNQYRFSRAAKNQSAAYSLAAVLAALALAGLLVYGWVWLVTLAVNYVLTYFGLKPVGMLFVWICMFLLSTVGGYFKSQKVKVES